MLVAANCLADLGDLGGAIAQYRAQAERFGADASLRVRVSVAKGSRAHVEALAQTQRHEQAIAVTDELLAREGDAEEAEMLREVTWALRPIIIAVGVLFGLAAWGCRPIR